MKFRKKYREFLSDLATKWHLGVRSSMTVTLRSSSPNLDADNSVTVGMAKPPAVPKAMTDHVSFPRNLC